MQQAQFDDEERGRELICFSRTFVRDKRNNEQEGISLSFVGTGRRFAKEIAFHKCLNEYLEI